MHDTQTTEHLQSIINSIERLEEQRIDLANIKCEVYSAAKSNGFDVKAIREIIKKRKLDRNERIELENIVELYMQQLGMGE